MRTSSIFVIAVLYVGGLKSEFKKFIVYLLEAKINSYTHITDVFLLLCQRKDDVKEISYLDIQ